MLLSFFNRSGQARRVLSSACNPLAGLGQYYRFLPDRSLRERLDNLEHTKQEISERRARTNGNLVQAIHQKLRCLWTYHSNAIEGSRLSLGDTIFFLQEGLTVGGKPLKDFLDARNHDEAIDYLYNTVTGEYDIDCQHLRSMNQLLLQGIDTIPAVDQMGRPVQKKLYSGQYKSDPNYVLQPDGTIHEYVEPHLVAGQLSDLCQWINHSQLHPVATASIAHYNMVRIHPFQDGNGRGARLLMNLILLKADYIPAVIVVDQRDRYLAALKAADQGNLSPFVAFVADAVQNTQAVVLDEINHYLANQSGPTF